MLGPPCFLSLPPPLPHQQIATSLGGTIAPSISVKNGNLSCNTDFQVTFNNGKGAATKCPFRIEQTEFCEREKNDMCQPVQTMQTTVCTWTRKASKDGRKEPTKTT